MELLQVSRYHGNSEFLQISTRYLIDTVKKVESIFRELDVYYNELSEMWELHINRTLEVYSKLRTINKLDLGQLVSIVSVVKDWDKDYSLKLPVAKVTEEQLVNSKKALKLKRCVLTEGNILDRFTECIIAGGSIPHKKVVICSVAYKNLWIKRINELYPDDKVVELKDYLKDNSIKADWVIESASSISKNCEFFLRGTVVERALFPVAIVEESLCFKSVFTKNGEPSNTYKGVRSVISLSGYTFIPHSDFKFDKNDNYYHYLVLLKNDITSYKKDNYRKFHNKFNLKKLTLEEKIDAKVELDEIIDSIVVKNSHKKLSRINVPAVPKTIKDKELMKELVKNKDDFKLHKKDFIELKYYSVTSIISDCIKNNKSILVSCTSLNFIKKLKSKYKQNFIDLNCKISNLDEVNSKSPKVCSIGNNTDLNGFVISNIDTLIITDISQSSQAIRENIFINGSSPIKTIYYLELDNEFDKNLISTYLESCN